MRPITEHFSRMVGHCVHPELMRDTEHYHQARILSGVLLLYCLFTALIIAYLLLFAPVPMQSALWSAALCVGLLLCYAGMLYALRYTLHYTRVALGAVFVTWVGLIGGVGISGGPLVSPATPMLPIPVILAFLLLGRYYGILWGLVVLTGHMVGVALEGTVINFPQLLEEGYGLIHHTAHWSIVYMALIALLVVYDSTRQRLKLERDMERNRYAYLAAHDPLTGLANRTLFEESVDRAIARYERNGEGFSLLYVDLDGFKPVNDRLGHDAGDRLLQVIAGRLKDRLRKNDVVARLGGDEFAILLDGIGSRREALQVAGRVVHWINEPCTEGASQLQVGASIGVALFPQHGGHGAALRRAADLAMYRAKGQGNESCVYDPERDRV